MNDDRCKVEELIKHHKSRIAIQYTLNSWISVQAGKATFLGMVDMLERQGLKKLTESLIKEGETIKKYVAWPTDDF